MNVIQKFKQGRKIAKFKVGGGGWAGFYTVGNVPRSTASKSSTRKRYLLDPDVIWHSRGYKVISRNGVDMVDPRYDLMDLISKQEDRPIQDTPIKNKSSKPQTKDSKTNVSNTSVNRGSKTNTNTSGGSKTSQPLYYTSKYKGKVPEKLSSRDAVRNFQEKYLKDYYTPGTYNPDGVWGDNTQAAYDRYLVTLAQNIQPTTTPVVETPVVTPEVEVPVVVQEYRPGIYNNEGYIPMAGSYTNVNGLYDYIINNPTSREAMLFNNAYGNLFNRELFDRIMNQYGISGHLGRRDTKRLNGLLDLLKQIGTDGSNERNDFIKTINNPSVLYNRNGGLLSKNPIQRFKLKRGGKFFKL